MTDPIAAAFAGDKCPTCAGPVAVVLKRAWCIQQYSLGGCGSYWEMRDGRWKLMRDAKTG